MRRASSKTEGLGASSRPDGFDRGDIEVFEVSAAGEGVFVDPPVVVCTVGIIVERLGELEVHVCGDTGGSEKSAGKESLEGEHLEIGKNDFRKKVRLID